MVFTLKGRGGRYAMEFADRESCDFDDEDLELRSAPERLPLERAVVAPGLHL